MLRVLVVGNAPAGPDSRGGMASVVRQMQRSAATDPDVDVTVAATFRDVDALRRALTWARGVGCVYRLLLAGGVDVVHVHLSHGGSVARKALPLLFARRRHVPVVLHAHSFNFATWFDALPRPARWLVRRVLRADRVIVLSDSQALVYRDRLRLRPGRIEVVANPASLPQDRPADDERASDAPVRAVFLGRYGVRKGIGDLLAAVSRLDDHHRSRLRLVTAGDGDIDTVRRDVEQLGLRDVVEVRGWIDPQARDDLLAAADVFVLPSYDEALPMALIEAMAFRAVPVVTPVGGIPDLVRDGHNGVLVPPGDIEGLRQALARTIDEPEWVAAMSDRARASVEDLDSASWWDRLTGLWRGLSADAPRAAASTPTPPPSGLR